MTASTSASTAAWAGEPTDRSRRMVADAAPVPFWLDRAERPAARERLVGEESTDLLVIGGGFTGLWAAVQAAEENPSRSIVLVEGARIAEGATGRNGGFCAASLVHGLGNGFERYADELATLQRMGRETLAEIAATLTRLGIDADAEHTGELDLANFDWQAAELDELVTEARRLGEPVESLDAEQARARVNSPLVAGGLFDPDVMIIDPAKLAWGLAVAADRLGVRIYEHTQVRSLSDTGDAVVATTALGSIRAQRVIAATSASTPLVRKVGWMIVPVWDYVIVTEPLTDQQLASIGWNGREGLSDCGNRFHYFRLTADNRILFGGYDAFYYYGGKTDSRLADKPEEAALLAEHLLQVFPQLEGIKVSHTWGGIIDTCSRFNAFWDVSMGGRVVTVVGFTGLGVGASHFGARTALDLVDGRDTERTRLEMVKSKPLPFPPEPVRWFGITLTRRELARSDRNRGKRGVWLRVLDALGLGFDS